jgi:transposase-like protein
MDRDSLRLLLAQGVSVEEIGRRCGKTSSTISYWLKKFGLEAPSCEKYAARGGIERGRLEELVEAGLTIRQIAAALDRSASTVRYWLRWHGIRTQNRRGRRQSEAAQSAKDEGRLTIAMVCRHHGETEFFLEGRGCYPCKRCRTEAVSRRRRKVKATLVAEAGGRCVICGYNRHVRALAFHHVNPMEKRLEINAKGVAVSLERLRAEAKKCVLLCANCHAEVEDGVASLPLEFLRTPNQGYAP